MTEEHGFSTFLKPLAQKRKIAEMFTMFKKSGDEAKNSKPAAESNEKSAEGSASPKASGDMSSNNK